MVRRWYGDGAEWVWDHFFLVPRVAFFVDSPFNTVKRYLDCGVHAVVLRFT